MPANPKLLNSGGNLYIVDPYVILDGIFPDSVTWDDNLQPTYRIENRFTFDVPLRVSRVWYTQDLVAQSVVPAAATLLISADGTGRWIQGDPPPVPTPTAARKPFIWKVNGPSNFPSPPGVGAISLIHTDLTGHYITMVRDGIPQADIDDGTSNFYSKNQADNFVTFPALMEDELIIITVI